jgi:prepilin-type N-terminal cleavage/methylation domain-containing protein
MIWGHSPFSGKRGQASGGARQHHGRGLTPFARKWGVTPNRQRGVTLVELICTITVISMAGAALMGTLSYLAGAGGDSIRQSQAQSIADAYLAEISGMAFVDPDGVDGEANRALWDDIDDYAGLNTSTATDKSGNAAGNFAVRVNLANGGLGALPANAVWRIEVTVNYDVDAFVIATGYRTNHP